jgi:hypothetical protein
MPRNHKSLRFQQSTNSILPDHDTWPTQELSGFGQKEQPVAGYDFTPDSTYSFQIWRFMPTSMTPTGHRDVLAHDFSEFRNAGCRDQTTAQKEYGL